MIYFFFQGIDGLQGPKGEKGDSGAPGSQVNEQKRISIYLFVILKG